MLTSREYLEIMYGLHSCKRARDWGETIALEYWFHATTDFYGATTEGNDLTAFGWTVTGSPPYIVGSGADFLSADDKGTTGGVHLDTADDILQSPVIFGSYAHGAAVANLIGRISGNGTPDLPRFLIADFYGRYSANNAETATTIGGFIEDGGAADVANDHLAAIVTDGTNFVLRSGAATSSAIVVDDTNPHHFKIVIDRINALAYGYVDDMSPGAGKSIAIEADEFPVSFGAGVLTSTGANDPVLNWARIRYAWHGWQ